MASVRVEQRNAHLAGAVRLEYLVNGEERLAKAVLTAISNVRRGSGEAREEESTAVQWTLWGRLAENANQYLGKGSHVNIVGRLRNNNYQDKSGVNVYAFSFTAEETDFLDSRGKASERGSVPEDEGWGESSLEPPARRGRAAAGGSSAPAKR
ncbi:single-stranded DNA-binding protein [Nostoc sp. CHAB 5836]|nr:single-stranded DNA-binding protein [Nostoc sp. CHAB 5836]